MVKIFTRSVLRSLFILSFLFTGTLAFAQTITIRDVDAGPYGRGSSIAVPITVDETGGRIGLANRYNLYLSDANGNFGSPTLIGSFNGFYTGFLNGVLPDNLAAGTGYRVRVQSTVPAIVSAPSAPFTVNAVTGVKAVAASPTTSSASAEVFGTCAGENGNRYSLNSALSSNHTVTYTLYNDMSRQNVGGTIAIDPIGQTPALPAASYTVNVKAVNSDGTIGTKAYLLINNKVLINFGSENSGARCLQNGLAEVNFNVDITTARSIEANYPGTVYTATWGDGTSQNYTFAQIKAAGGILVHTFLKSSCGARNAQGNITNQFLVRFSLVNPYCPPSSADNAVSFTTNQAVLLPPKNSISGPTRICLNTEAVFVNTSDPGQTATPGNTSGCKFNDATYTWYVDGVPKAIGKKLTDKFPWTFTTRGPHTVSIEMENSQSECVASGFTLAVCVQEAPKPEFTIPATACIGSGTVTPTDQSVLDNICSDTYTYKWTVTPETGFTYAAGTNAASKVPQFTFNTPGNYAVFLEISNTSCGSFKSTTKQIVVTAPPVAALSASFSLCGRGQTLTFDNTVGSQTRTTLTGTVNPQPDTYQWTVTPQGGIAAATFENGTTANSQYPQIKFPDFGTYDVVVTHKNECGGQTSTVQQITFKEAPTVLAGPDQPSLCPGATAQLDGSVTGVYNTLVWTSTGTGTFNNKNIAKPIYTPSAADLTAGQVTLRLSITTSLPGDCATIFDEVVIKINPANALTSAPSKTICTGSAVNYTPESNVAGSTFIWTVTANSANASGFTSSGTGTINDVLSNTSPNTNATVTYTITPQANGCDGTPFTFTVTVAPKPEITLAAPAGNIICSGSAAGIQITPNITGTQYTWTVTADANITGAAGQTTATATPTINQVLVNTGNTAATVTYVVTPVNVNSADICGGQPQTITITVQPVTPPATAGADATLCNQSSYTLQGNDPGNFAGSWTLTSGQSGVTFVDATKYNTVVNGLQGGQTYTFRWTIAGAAPCAPQSDDVSVVNNPPIANNIITLANATSCANQTITIIGSPATGGNGTPVYLWEMSTDGVSWIAMNSQTGKDLTIAVSESTYFRRSVSSGPCADDKSNVVQAIVLPAITNNTITPTQPSACVNESAGQINGSDPSGADGTYTYQWQSSTDQGATWNNIASANDKHYITPALTSNIMYRRVVSSSVCQIDISTPVTITVSQKAIAKILFTTEVSCAPFILREGNNIRAEEYPDRNAEYQWYVNGTPVGTGVNFPSDYVLNAPGQSAIVKLVTVGFNNCQPNGEDTHEFKTVDQFTLGFTASRPIVNNVITVCGTTDITFTNTSTPIGSATYNWSFNGGASPASSTQVQPGAVTFAASTNGDDRIYTVTLSATPQCGVATPKTITVIVTAGQPLPVIDATVKQQCGTLTTSVKNLTNGTNKEYYIYVENAATGQRVYTSPVTTTKDAQTVTINEIGNFNIYMVATSLCGVSVTSTAVPVTVVELNSSSILQVASGQLTEGCSPLTVRFNNLSNNITSYWYDWGDGTRSQVFNTSGGTIPSINHTYTTTASESVYYPKLWVRNACSTTEQLSTNPPIAIIVRGLPQPAFTFTKSESATCNGCTLVRFNNTTPDANGNTTYTWNFGDGSPLSTERNPEHVYDYSKGATYSVTLTAVNNTCNASITKVVDIPAPVTQLSLPNAFTPSSLNPELSTFRAKGLGLKTWHMRIFNNYGQLVWETTKLDALGEPTDGWDGTFGGSPLPQGVYVWQIEASFIDGSEWKGMSYNNSSPKRTGVIHLIR
jgi:PKD repeat protein